MRRSAAMDSPIVVVSVVIARGDLVLIGERPDGHWAFPGGKQHRGETPLQASRRELSEETGLFLVEATPLYFADCQTDHGHFVTLFLEGAADGEPELREPDKCQRWCWLTVDDIPEPRLLGTAQLLAAGFRPGSSLVRQRKTT